MRLAFSPILSIRSGLHDKGQTSDRTLPRNEGQAVYFGQIVIRILSKDAGVSLGRRVQVRILTIGREGDT